MPFGFSSLPCTPKEGLNIMEGFMLPIKMKSPPKSILGPAEPHLPGFGNRIVTERQYSTSGIKPEGSP